MGCGIASQTWASLCLYRAPGRAGLCSGQPAACGFGLFCRFQRNVLDLSLQWRFANLPNNAKLEMVPISRSREGPENMVRIALQLDDGSRLQDTFCSGQTLWELLCHFAHIRECLDRPCEASPVCVYMRDEVTGRAALQSTTLQSLGLTGGSAIIRFSMKPHDSTGKQEPGVSWSKSPGSPTPSLLADQAASSPLFPLNSAGLSQGDVSHQDEAARPGAGRVDGLGPKPVDAQAKQISKEPTPAPFVPFSGGGQRLGGPSGSVRPLMSSSAKLPKSFSSPAGPSQPKKSRPGQEPQPEPELTWPAELPDEFFEVTVDDVRRRLAQLKSERLDLARPIAEGARPWSGSECGIPAHPTLPPAVGDLRDFVRSHLGNPKLPFYLCKCFSGTSCSAALAPPSWGLKQLFPQKQHHGAGGSEHESGTGQANLFPAALVHFGPEEPTGIYLEPTLLEHTVSPSAADVLVASQQEVRAASPEVPLCHHRTPAHPERE
ncbi:hypothetical protein E2I00_012906 [Balaenoptera physalus]|uniref:TUG ubiquitin-like domain-containing protein n=1 Tax=Balaenoptera physalus TaxID=9770 RepID=A0A643C728_BALPH|nr:hypothetical protein E2I00_012906 [Balaenoptera physalus]